MGRVRLNGLELWQVNMLMTRDERAEFRRRCEAMNVSNAGRAAAAAALAVVRLVDENPEEAQRLFPTLFELRPAVRFAGMAEDLAQNANAASG